MCGRVDKVIVRYEVIPITDEILGDYAKDKAYRKVLHQTLHQYWLDKDELIDSLLKQESDA